MPKFGGHIVIGEAVGKHLGYSETDLNGEIGNALRLGAIGPDLTLFLLDPAEDNKFIYQSLSTGMRVYREIRKVRDKLEEINNYIGKPAAEIASWFSGGFSDSLLEFAGLAVHSFVGALQCVAFTNKKIEVLNPFQGLDAEILSRVFGADMIKWSNLPKVEVSWNFDSSQVTSPAYIFRHFGAPYTEDPPFKEKAVVGDYSEWWWMDVLHYRRTTQFARELLVQAQSIGDPILIAYAQGYFSHVGGDIVGHPYINSMVGGPFRNHALRHMVVESLLDVQIWKDNKAGAEIFNSRLDKLVNVSEESLKSISELIHKCLENVFVNPGGGLQSIHTRNFGRGAPTADNITTAYSTMLGYLGFSTDIGLNRPEKPAGNIGDVWDEIRDHVQKSIDKISHYHHDLGSSSGWDWFAALIGLVIWSAVLLVQLLTLPSAIVARIVAIAPRWLFYLINSALYDFVCNIRYCMALSGWGYAGIDDLGRSKSKELLEVNSVFFEGYPAAMAPRVDGFWLDHPEKLGTQTEQPASIPGPYHNGQGPDTFIKGLPFDQVNEDELTALAYPPLGANESWTAATLRRIETIAPGSAFFGNAVDFTIRMINGQYPDAAFDLDGDRGYASLQWQQYPPNTEYIP